MAVDSQELKFRIEDLISHLDSEESEVQILWDFVQVVKDRALEPCLQDICDRLERLKVKSFVT